MGPRVRYVGPTRGSYRGSGHDGPRSFSPDHGSYRGSGQDGPRGFSPDPRVQPLDLTHKLTLPKRLVLHVLYPTVICGLSLMGMDGCGHGLTGKVRP